MVTTDPKLTDCPALVTIRAISGKWKTRILWLLRDGPLHFGEIRRRLPGVSAKVLSAQMRELEDAGIVSRQEEVRAGVTHAVYAYTEYGRTLIPALNALGQWGLAHVARS